MQPRHDCAHANQAWYQGFVFPLVDYSEMLTLRTQDILRFDFIERPNPRSVRHALDLLISLGAIDKHSHEITEHGSIMADFPLKPQMSKALVSSVEYNCTNDIVTIAAMTYGRSH